MKRVVILGMIMFAFLQIQSIEARDLCPQKCVQACGVSKLPFQRCYEACVIKCPSTVTIGTSFFNL